MGAIKEIVMGILISLLSVWIFSGTSYFAHADGYAEGGFGINNSTNSHLMALGYRDALPFGLIEQFEAGYFSDQSGYGRRSSGWTGYSAGFAVDTGDTIARYVVGPA